MDYSQFDRETILLENVPIGTPCVSDLDIDLNTRYPEIIIQSGRDGYRVIASVVNSQTSKSEERLIIGRMRVCPKLT